MKVMVDNARFTDWIQRLEKLFTSCEFRVQILTGHTTQAQKLHRRKRLKIRVF